MMRDLYRAVDDVEREAILDEDGRFTDSPHTPQFKGFFFELMHARAFGDRMSMIDGVPHVVFETGAPDEAVDRGTPHKAAGEGPGVYLLREDWILLSPAVLVTS